ncbi:hypothetical protein F4604DRAFT_1781664 [Suillus subluteus]|nr:hypothetical protein F4604DRAFT_1781664 [Suillus subluteus]
MNYVFGSPDDSDDWNEVNKCLISLKAASAACNRRPEPGVYSCSGNILELLHFLQLFFPPFLIPRLRSLQAALRQRFHISFASLSSEICGSIVKITSSTLTMTFSWKPCQVGRTTHTRNLDPNGLVSSSFRYLPLIVRSAPLCSHLHALQIAVDIVNLDIDSDAEPILWKTRQPRSLGQCHASVIGEGTSCTFEPSESRYFFPLF